MLDHELFDKYEFENIPLETDCYLIDESDMEKFNDFCLKMFSGEDCDSTFSVCTVAARKRFPNLIEMSWLSDMFTRWHEVTITLPKEQFVTCIDCWEYDIKPYIFVKSEWLEKLLLNVYSIFGLIDAIDIKKTLLDGALTKEKFILLRAEIDKIAKSYPEILFISFADSILLKGSWKVGYFKRGISCTYKPETFLHILKEIQSAYKRILGLNVYAVFVQGINEYYEETLHHISESNNHICLNSLGIPFAQLKWIEDTAKKSIKSGTHPPSEVYMDEHFFRSLDFNLNFDRESVGNNEYTDKLLQSNRSYLYCQCQFLLDNLNRK